MYKNQILEIEKHCKTVFSEYDKQFSILSFSNKNTFELDANSEIIGLNIEVNDVEDFSFLRNVRNLQTLRISSNEFSDYSFFKYLNKITSLSLSLIQFLDLTFLENLSQLKTLDLSDNNILDISLLKCLTGLTDLNLCENKLIDISVLKYLTQLKTLSLWDNQVSDISVLKNLTELVSLDLDDNKISDISPLRGLKKLKNLYISNNEILDYSPFFELNQLIYLDINRSKILDFDFLKSLTELTSCGLWGSEISDISFLKNLTKLKSLRLWDNKITDISILKNLTLLENLNISHNKIHDISALKDLRELNYLDLNNNKISDISVLQNLHKLKDLNLSNNKITDLRPLEFLIAKNIKILSFEKSFHSQDGLSVYRNPITIPPIEVIEQDNETILQYFEDARSYGLNKLNECKLIFVGDGGLGKTSLMKKIIGLPFTDEETTHGINKKSWNEIRNADGEDIKVNLWDFGGQHIQHSLHQFFLTEKVIYILLLNPRNDTNAMYWLEQIDKLGKDSEILIVYNWKDIKDKDSHTIKNFYELRKTYPKLKEPFLLSCKEGENFDYFKRELIKIILNQKDLLVKYPLNWFAIKEELEKNVTINKNYIAYNEYDLICENNKYTNEISKKNLLKQLDKIGSIVFFDKPILNDLQVLNPDWITTGAYSVITSEITNDKKGHLNYRDLQKIFKDDKSIFANEEIKLKYKDRDFQFIISLMTEYDLCVLNPFVKNEYLIPCAFEGEKPLNFEVFKEESKQYRFRFESAFEMLIMYRFMARNIFKCVKNGYWQSGIVIKDIDTETYALVETNQYSKIIDFWIKGDNIRELWESLRRDIKDINSKYSLKYQEQVLYYSKDDRRNVFLSYDEMVDTFRNGIRNISYHPTYRIHNIDVLKVIDHFEDTQKIVEEMEKKNINYYFNGDNNGQMQMGGENNTQKNYVNNFFNSPQVQELKDILEDLEDLSKNNTEWQQNFTNVLTELYRLEEAEDNIQEKKSISKIQKFFIKAKEVKDWVAIGVLPVELLSKGKKMIELGEKLFNLVS